ncbi:MAG TPA: SusC/RagA family TonB-linked outer membrane protein [Paludibacteraceae bacterium]|nr:SusC/RagA family TonB-linked outer membrane protein [Paludibacteraceae bacterium]
MKKKLILICMLLLTLAATAQKKAVTGTVTDTNKEPLIGATVREAGTTNGTLTNFDGNFTLNVADGATLEVSYVGYTSAKIKASFGSPNLVSLKDDAALLDEVVITGYTGTQVRSRSTNSIAKVDNKKLTVGVFSNPGQALSGAVSGLRVTQTSGNPGAAPTITLRGGTNLDGSGSPLVIVDGQIRGSLSDINPEDIEDMQVMKDAGATAIYGARANNGVILITTKKGKSGQSEINFKAKVGVNNLINPYKFTDAETYLTWQRNAYLNSHNVWTKADGTPVGFSPIANLTKNTPMGTGNSYFASDGKTILNDGNSIWSTMYLNDQNKILLDQGWQKMRDPAYDFMLANYQKPWYKSQFGTTFVPQEYLIFKNTNPADYNFKDPSYTQDYNVNMSGGNDKGHYYSGIGYNYSQGLPINSYYKRYSFIFNGDYKIKPWLTSISSINYGRANWQSMPGSQGDEANYFSRILSVPPTVRFSNEDGTPRLGNNAGDGNQNFQPNQWFIFNQTDKFTMNQAFKVDFTKSLYLRMAANWYYSEGNYESFTKDYYNTPTQISTNRSTSAEFNRSFEQTYNAVLNYEKQINSHYLAVMLGTEFYDSFYNGFSASGSGAATDDFRDLSLTSSDKDKRSIDSYHTQQRILSFFGRVNYDYMGKYILSAVVRRDGYSRLIDNRWGTFPGFSAGWMFSKESFMNPLKDVISFGKLKTSYGLNGNVSGIGAYELQGGYSGSTKYNGQSTFILSSVPNPGLIWEKTRTFEVGLDLSYFENRYSTNFTLYDRLTSDKFASLSLPSSSGISSIRTNNGQFRNRGLEIELAAKPLQSKNWNWSINANIAYNKNTVVKLPNNGLPLNRQQAFQVYSGKDATDLLWVGGYQEGQEPGVLYVWQADGIYKNESEIPDNMKVLSYNYVGAFGGPSKTLWGKAQWAAMSETDRGTSNYPIQPGDVKWKDINGDNIIDEYDKVKVGNTTPHWIGGINSTLSWKNLSLYTAFDYALGFWMMDYRLPWLMGNMQGTYAMPMEVTNTWTSENPDAKYPRYTYADQLGKGNYLRSSTLFTNRGDYLSFRQISLTYSVPREIINKGFIQKLDISVTGQNLGYLTAGKTFANPEKGGGIVDAGYSLPRTVTFGLNISF